MTENTEKIDEIAKKKQIAARKRRINREIKRLSELFSSVNTDELELNFPLIERAAHMRILIEDLEDIINIEGSIEDFSQTKDISYERETVASRQYATFTKIYPTIIKQLTALLPTKELQSSVNNQLVGFIMNDPRK
jgi:hypothetical protein